MDDFSKNTTGLLLDMFLLSVRIIFCSFFLAHYLLFRYVPWAFIGIPFLSDQAGLWFAATVTLSLTASGMILYPPDAVLCSDLCAFWLTHNPISATYLIF